MGVEVTQDVVSGNHGPDKSEWRERACRAEDRLRRIEPERDEYKAAWLDTKAALDRLKAWEAEVIAALEGLPDNTAPDAIRVLREQRDHFMAEADEQHLAKLREMGVV